MWVSLTVNLRSPVKSVGFENRLRSIKNKEDIAAQALVETRDFICSSSIGALSVAVDQPEHETDQSFPSSFRVKNVWSCTTIPPNAFMA